MQQIIRFRLLADTLLPNEFDSLLDQLGTKTILKALFSFFHTQIQNGANNSLTEASNIVSKIIESRTSKKLKQILIESKKQSKLLSLNELPFPIIGKCASYLQFMDYDSLQKVSRRVFIGCNDPNTLIKIDLKMLNKIFKSKQHSKLIKYKKVKHFQIDTNDFCKMTSIHNLLLSKNTKSLSLHYRNNLIMKSFLNTKCWSLDKIEMLKLHGYYGCVIDTFDLLKHFKNIKFLELYCYLPKTDGFRIIFDNEQFRNKILNNLQGLSLCASNQHTINFYDRLLHYFSDKLLSLHLNANINIIKSQKNGFINLKEVCIKNAKSDTINDIIKTAKKLERVHLQFFNCYTKNDNKLEDILMELLSQKTLEFISIQIDRDIEKIKNVLKKISFSKRKRLKIRFYIQYEIEKVNEYLEILKNKFIGDGVIDDWMIIFRFQFIETMRKHIIGNTQNFKIGDRTKLFFHNKQCKINGFRERWLYYCFCN